MKSHFEILEHTPTAQPVTGKKDRAYHSPYAPQRCYTKSLLALVKAQPTRVYTSLDVHGPRAKTDRVIYKYIHTKERQILTRVASISLGFAYRDKRYITCYYKDGALPVK